MKRIIFDLEENKDKNIVIHCETEQEAKLWCNFMHAKGLMWNTEESYFETTNYDEYGADTCYTLCGTYSYKTYFTNNNYDIIEFSDIYIDDGIFTKDMLENFMVVQTRTKHKFMVSKNYSTIFNSEGHMPFSNYNNELIATNYNGYDIVKVYKPKSEYQLKQTCWDSVELIWERPIEQLKLWNGKTYGVCHKEMWTWLSQNTEKGKFHWFDINNINNEPTPHNQCFACEQDKTDGIMNCTDCPLGEFVDNYCLNGLFEKWLQAETPPERSKYAYQIANLKWTEKQKEI